MANLIDRREMGINSGVYELGEAFEVLVEPGAKTVVVRFDNGYSVVFNAEEWQEVLELWEDEKAYTIMEGRNAF